jgi:ATP-dependent RNA helicase DDX52/ROK1
MFRSISSVAHASFHLDPQKEPSKTVGVASGKILDGELPGELDYFKYAAGGSGKRKAGGDSAKVVKKRKVDEEEEEDVDMDEQEEPDDTEDAPSKPRQRIVAKGSNPPAHADTFNELVERYQMSTLLLSNLTRYGYTDPTGIQSYGIPILLEVFQTFFHLYCAHIH